MIVASAIRKIKDESDELSIIIYTGKRHSDIINSKEKGELKNCLQGFINDCGDFLTRTQALHEAFECNQISLELYKDRLQGNKELFSEDLW